MFYLIGLGLCDAEDISCKGLKVVKRAKRVYLEAYTSLLSVGKDVLENFYGREVILADREMVEQHSDEMLKDAAEDDIAFLVVGDPFGATTHMDLMLRAKESGVQCSVIHNASILNAVGCCGLQLYNFGETVSIVFWTDTWQPESFYDKIESNIERGLHTLCLLDIKVKEQSIENLMRGRKVYEPPTFMSVNQAATQLLSIVERRREAGQKTVVTEDTICIGMARVGSDTQKIVSAPLCRMSSVDLGPPLHSFIVTGNMHPLEEDMLKHFSVSADSLTVPESDTCNSVSTVSE